MTEGFCKEFDEIFLTPPSLLRRTTSPKGAARKISRNYSVLMNGSKSDKRRMKMKKFCSIFLAVIIVLFTVQVCFVSALESGFSTEKMSSDEQENIISHLRIEQTDKEPRNNALLCFDVSDNGYVAIGSESLPKKNISVYDEKGSFIYGYNFKSDGSFGVGWKNDFLVIYLVRENAAITINNNGDVLLCEEIKDTAENSSYWNNEIFSAERTRNNTRYTMKNKSKLLNIFETSYSVLERTDESGVSTVYDNSSNYEIKLIAECLGIIVIIIIAIVCLTKQFKKRKIDP